MPERNVRLNFVECGFGYPGVLLYKILSCIGALPVGLYLKQVLGASIDSTCPNRIVKQQCWNTFEQKAKQDYGRYPHVRTVVSLDQQGTRPDQRELLSQWS